jgi:hypothetical protein
VETEVETRPCRCKGLEQLPPSDSGAATAACNRRSWFWDSERRMGRRGWREEAGRKERRMEGKEEGRSDAD